MEVAIELIDDAINRPEQSGYACIVALDPQGSEEHYLGYLCYGPTPMTLHTYDLYWMAVDPTQRGKGVGKRLCQALDETLRHKGGKVIRAETSSRDDYDGTVAFYLAIGYEMAGRIKDFYRPDDDLIILCKTL